MDCLKRYIDMVMMFKSLYMFHWAKGKRYLAGQMDLDTLKKRVVKILTSTECTKEVLELLGVTDGDIDPAASTWISVAILQVPGMTSEKAADVLPDITAYHKGVSIAMASHATLTLDAINRSHYASGALLSKDAKKAREGAKTFQDLLLYSRADERTHFESTFMGDDELMT